MKELSQWMQTQSSRWTNSVHFNICCSSIYFPRHCNTTGPVGFDVKKNLATRPIYKTARNMHIFTAQTPWRRDRTPESCAQHVFCLALLYDGVFRIAICRCSTWFFFSLERKGVQIKPKSLLLLRNTSQLRHVSSGCTRLLNAAVKLHTLLSSNILKSDILAS